MQNQVITELQDFRRLEWSRIRHSSGTAGSFLKSKENIRGIKWYYKLSDFDAYNGIIGHECINEIIVDRLLTILGIEHLNYELIHADIEIENLIQIIYKNKGTNRGPTSDSVGNPTSELSVDPCPHSDSEQGLYHLALPL